MTRPPKGIYRNGDAIGLSGSRRSVAPAAYPTWETVTDAAARALLRETPELADLMWDGTTVVRRDQAAIDARLRAETMAADDGHFDRERDKAVLLLILDEINVLRESAGLPPRTIQQAKNAYRAKLNR